MANRIVVIEKDKDDVADALPAILIFYNVGKTNNNFCQKMRTHIPVPQDDDWISLPKFIRNVK